MVGYPPTMAERQRSTMGSEPSGGVEMVAVEGPRGPVRAFAGGPRTLRDLYEHRRDAVPFLVDGDTRLSFAEAFAVASRIAVMLHDRCGVRPGDRVAIAMRNRAEWMLSFMAATSIGAVTVALNSLWTPIELGFAIADSSPSVLIADRQRAEAICADASTVPPRLMSVDATDIDALRIDLEELRYAPAVELPDVSVRPDDLATILYTSGSTGHPKGVASTHRAVLTALIAWDGDPAAPAAPATDRATLLGTPLFHVLGLHGAFLWALYARERVVTMSRWDVEHALELIERERITTFTATPTMTDDLARAARRSFRDLTSLDAVGGGGAARAPQHLRRLAASFPRAVPATGWAMTETNGLGTSISGDDYLDRPTSCGRALAAIDLRVVDDDGLPVPAGTRGELQARGASLFSGYWNRPAADAEVFTPDGWFRTGDIAVIDCDGYLSIVDRAKDLIIRGGENIGCGYVEAALLEYPSIVEAAVYGLPDDRLGEVVAATIAAESVVDELALRAFLADRLAPYEIPEWFDVRRSPLPRTDSGKLLKRRLRDEAIASLAAD